VNSSQEMRMVDMQTRHVVGNLGFEKVPMVCTKDIKTCEKWFANSSEAKRTLRLDH